MRIFAYCLPPWSCEFHEGRKNMSPLLIADFSWLEQSPTCCKYPVNSMERMRGWSEQADLQKLWLWFYTLNFWGSLVKFYMLLDTFRSIAFSLLSKWLMAEENMNDEISFCSYPLFILFPTTSTLISVVLYLERLQKLPFKDRVPCANHWNISAFQNCLDFL